MEDIEIARNTQLEKITKIAAPTITWTGVCPRTSTNLSDTCKLVNPGVSTILFNSLACFPAALLTPAASYITINEKIKATANNGELIPTFLPIIVVKDITTPECELGIPPACINLLKLNFLLFTKS